jgi:hypothetical protein
MGISLAVTGMGYLMFSFIKIIEKLVGSINMDNENLTIL